MRCQKLIDGVAPVREAVLYKATSINSSSLVESKFAGNPGSQADEAWDDLMSREYTPIRLPPMKLVFDMEIQSNSQ